MSEADYGDISDKSKRMAWLLTLSGTIPFAVLAIVLVFAPHDFAQLDLVETALVTYGAVILSFIGGIRWGVALTRAEGRSATQVFVLSVLPALIGWGSVFVDQPMSYIILAIAFFLHGIWDYGAWCTDVIQEWFVKLRMIETALVIVSLLIAAIATF